MATSNRSRPVGMLGILTLVSALMAIPTSGAENDSNPSSPATKVDWPSPDIDRLSAGPWRDLVAYGQRLITETDRIVGPLAPDPAMRYSRNGLTCQNCHLAAGTKQFALPLIGVYGAFPAYMAREDEVRTLEDRINGCMERSMNGRAIPLAGREMKAMLAYINFLSTGVPVGKATEGRGVPPLPPMSRAADPARGAMVYQQTCANCHGADGSGKRRASASGYEYPPLWGPGSFNDGAGMHRLIASASFIHANMPFGASYAEPILPAEDAWDVAAYVNSRPRPKKSGLDRDYPNRARKPADAPFPPFADNFPPEQHRLGPFQPIIDWSKAHPAQ